MTKKAKKSEPIWAEERMMTGAEILVRTLIHNGIDTIFAYPGGQSIPLHQAMSRYRDQLRVVLPRHEQGGGFAAQGYARSTGKIGVCMTTSGPGATNLVTSISDAKLDSVPLLIITPLTFLGGSFYSIDMLPPFWQTVSLFNPVVYLISGFRWSFIGVSDVSVGVSLMMTFAFLAACLAIITWIFRTGYKLKN